MYEVRRVFAGGMGEVYLAYHRERRQLYALKTLQEKYFRSREEFLAFRREAEIWIMLGKHPHIVQAQSVRDFEGRLFLVLEYIEPDSEGRNCLSHYLTGPPLPLEQTLVWSLQFCQGMTYALNRGLKCHRDIKPGNLMIDSKKVLKITDFGLAKTSQEPETPAYFARELVVPQLGRYDITSPGYFRGTYAYMAPEAFDDYKGSDEISDIYSFGVTLFQMVTGGDLPFQPGVGDWKAYAHLHKHMPVPEVDSPLFPVIKRCMAKERLQRYRSFEELREDLEQSYRRLLHKPPPPPQTVAMTAPDLKYYAQALFELKKFPLALIKCDESLSLDRRDHETWDLRGRICQALERHPEALAAFEESLRLLPDYYSALNNKGVLLQKLGRLQEAQACFREVTRLRPSYREAWNNLGACCQLQGQLEEAKNHYRRAVQLDPNYRDAWINLGDCHIRQRRFGEALECYLKARHIDPYEMFIWETLVKLYRVLGRIEEARAAEQHLQELRKAPHPP